MLRSILQRTAYHISAHSKHNIQTICCNSILHNTQQHSQLSSSIRTLYTSTICMKDKSNNNVKEPANDAGYPVTSDQHSDHIDQNTIKPSSAVKQDNSVPQSVQDNSYSVENNHNEQSKHNVSIENRYDLLIIGSGPAGQKAAINASKMGKRVAIIDKRGMLGGVCIHTGTIPSKTFREAILYLTGYRQRGFYGKGHLRRDAITAADVLDRVRKVEMWETETVMDQLHRNGVVIIEGTARFVDEHHIDILPVHADNKYTFNKPPSPLVGREGIGNSTDSSISSTSTGNVLYGDKIMICVGTRPARNDMYPWSSPLIYDSDQILQRANWDRIRQLIVVGSGVIAMEYASMFAALPGCKVTIIDEKQNFLEFVDNEINSTLRHIMSKHGATFRLGEKVINVEANEDKQKIKVELESGKTVIGDALFYAVGRQANTDGLGLDTAGVELGKRGIINVNEYFQTNVNHIYASGDVIGFPALASTAMEQGRLASGHMFGIGKKFNPVFPYGIYTIPEISIVGKSEQQLTQQKIPYEVGKAKFEETAKGQMIGGQNIDGFLKLLFCPKTRKLLGASAIGESATEIIHIAQAVLSMSGQVDYFRDSVFNYPTMAETYRIAALDGLGRIGLTTGRDDVRL